MLKLKTILVEAENAIGLFLSRKRMQEVEKYLSKNNFVNYCEFDTYTEAVEWIQCRYGKDLELNLEEIQPNKLLFRDTTMRHNFYFYSDSYIGYGTNEEHERKILSELSEYDRMTGQFVYVETTYDAIYGARRGFDERYTGKNYFSGPMLAGELISVESVPSVKYHQRKNDLWDDEWFEEEENEKGGNIE